MSKKRKYTLGIAAAILLVIIVSALSLKKVINNDTYVVKRGNFEEVISCKGQIKSQSYTKINMPKEMTDEKLRIYYAQINDLVEEGTIVKKGDYVALLDQERIKDNLTRSTTRLQNYQNNLKMQVIDSTSQLTDLRNSIKELEYDLEYKKIEIKQAIYESQSYQDKVKRAYDRAKRKLEMKRRDYQRKKMQYASQCSRIENEVKFYTEQVEKLKAAQIASRIVAPADGMVIYASQRGHKRTKGDHVSRWSPEIAILPDLTKLIVESYIQEIDISKVNIGDKVRVVIDALPDKVFTGQLKSIANIGRTSSEVDGKIFDIKISINGSNPKIAHGMSSSNEIITYTNENAIAIPLEYVFTNDTSSYVYKKENHNFVMHKIEVARSNDEFAMISNGLSENDVITKTKPE